MHQAVDALRAAGAADRILAVGDRAPDFALPNSTEQLVDSRALRARGPLVVTFYRGRW
jgi:peroxiredoxin